MPIKFFPRDIVSGKADAPGDKFTAFFIDGDHEFEVMDEGLSRQCFFATLVS